MSRAELLQRLKALKPWLSSRGIARVRLFGSHARDAARSDSDVDLIVDLAKPLGLEFFAIQDELSARLGLRVEMFTEAELARDIRRTALADAIDA
jgi:predicted nucleotidyltransferase